MTKSPAPRIKRPGCSSFFPLRAFPHSAETWGVLSAVLNSGHTADSTQEGDGQSSACPLLPEETAPQEQPSGNTKKGYAYSALPKNSFKASTTWVTYSGLSYRSTWLAPSTTWIFLGSLARR